MSPSEAARALAQEGALQRQARQREPILAKARALRAELHLPPAPALNPPLILTHHERV